MDNKQRAIVKNAMKQLAIRDGITVQQVRLRIQEAMISGPLSPDPVIKMRWKEIPCEGEVPTPEELILYLAERVAGAAQDSCGE